MSDDKKLEQMAEQATPINATDPDGDLISGKNRDDALESAGKNLSEALSQIEKVGEENPELKEVLMKYNDTLRSQQRVLHEVSDLMKQVIHDIPQIVVGLTETESQMTTIMHKVDTVIRGLTDQSVISADQLQTVYREQIIPEYMEAMRSRAKEMGIEVPETTEDED